MNSGTGDQASVFGALADATRLRLVRLLYGQRGPDALCVNTLAERLGVTQPAVSQHLRVLKAIGLVRGEKRGTRMHYFIHREGLKRCRELALEALNVPEGGEEGCPCDCGRQTQATRTDQGHGGGDS